MCPVWVNFPALHGARRKLQLYRPQQHSHACVVQVTVIHNVRTIISAISDLSIAFEIELLTMYVQLPYIYSL